MKLNRGIESSDDTFPFDTEGVFVGLCRLEPGDVFPNHFHNSHEEIFFVVRGAAELWTEQKRCDVLLPGDLALCERGEQHFLRNASDTTFVAYFTKAPNLPDDRVLVPWTPPEIPHIRI